MICSAAMRPAASAAGTISVGPKNASRGSWTVSSRRSFGDGSSIDGGVREVARGLAPARHRGHESVCSVFVVGERHRRQDATVITEAEVELAVFA